MMRHFGRLLVMLAMATLLVGATAGGALAAPGKGQGSGSKPGRSAHAVGTITAYSAGKSISVLPRNPKKGTTAVTFTITPETRIVGHGSDAQAAPVPAVGARVNVVGRTASDGTNVARMIVVQGPEDDDKAKDKDDDDDNGKGKGKDKGRDKDDDGGSK